MRGPMPVGQVMVTPRSRLAEWDRVWGAVPFCPGLIPSPAGMRHCIPGAGLCTHRDSEDGRAGP